MEPQFRFSVWRPARLIRTFDYPVNTGGDGILVFEPNRLQEQIYIWDPGSNDVFASLDKELGDEFRLYLLEKFDPGLAPEERSIALLGKAVGNLNSKLQKTMTTPWADSQQTVLQGQNDDVNLRVNVPLALLNHLLWIAKVFERVPHASVTVR